MLDLSLVAFDFLEKLSLFTFVLIDQEPVAVELLVLLFKMVEHVVVLLLELGDYAVQPAYFGPVLLNLNRQLVVQNVIARSLLSLLIVVFSSLFQFTIQLHNPVFTAIAILMHLLFAQNQQLNLTL